MSGSIPPKVLGVQNGRRTRAEFRPRVYLGEGFYGSLWMPRDGRGCHRSSGATRRFGTEANAGVVDQYPRAIWIAALRLGACPLPVERQTLAPHVAHRHSPIVSS